MQFYFNKEGRLNIQLEKPYHKYGWAVPLDRSKYPLALRKLYLNYDIKPNSAEFRAYLPLLVKYLKEGK